MTVSCPIPEELLHDYFAGEMTGVDAHRLEEHAFECERCGRAFDRCGRLAARLRDLVPPVVGRERLERMLARGTPIRITPVAAGRPVTVEFSDDVTFLIHALRAELAGASRVDLEFLSPDGDMVAGVSYVPFDAERGEVLIACQHHYMDLYPRRSWFRLVAVVEGEKRDVGDYIVDHVVP